MRKYFFLCFLWNVDNTTLRDEVEDAHLHLSIMIISLSNPNIKIYAALN